MSFDEIFEAWYREASVWAPPGAGSHVICRECAWSPVLDVPILGDLPHDVAHGLVTRLNSYILDSFERQEELAEDEPFPDPWSRRHLERLTAYAARAEEIVLLAVERRMIDIVAVADGVECRLAAYLKFEASGLDPDDLLF